MSEAKVAASLVDPNGTDFGITQSKIILNEKTGELFTRDIYGQIKQLGSGSTVVQSGTAYSESMQSRERWFLYLTDYLTDADRVLIRAGTSVDLSAAMTLAIAALPTTGGVIDGSMVPCACSWASSVTVNKSGVVILLPKAGRITASALPFLSVSTNCSGVEIRGQSMGSNNGTVMRYTGTAAGDFIAYAKDANYGKVKGILFETTAALVGRVNGVHCVDVFDFETDDLFASDAVSGSHVNRLTGAYFEVATISQVPPRGNYRLGSMHRSSSDDAGITAVTGSRGYELLGIASGVIETVKFFGTHIIENVDTAVRIEKAAGVDFSAATKYQGNIRSFDLADCDSGRFGHLYSRANGAARFVEHARVDSSCFDLSFWCDFDTSFGTNSGTRCAVFNSSTVDWDFASIPLKNVKVEGTANTFLVTDSGDGMAMRLLASNDSTGFAGIGFRNVGNSATKSQIYWQASDDTLRFYQGGADRLAITSGGGLRALATSNGPAGTVTLTAASATTTVNNTAVTASSLIFLFPTSANAAADLGSATSVYISAKVAATSFTITHPNNANADKSFNYWIVN